MAYTVDLANAPDTAIVGEPMDVRLEVCCDQSGGCRETAFFLELDGIPIIRAGVAYGAAFCIDQFLIGGGNVKSQWPDWIQTNSNRELIIKQPGTYTLSWRGGSKELTVEPEPFDPALVTQSCSVSGPEDASPGDSFTITSTVENGNGEPADVELTFSFGDSAQTATATVAANDTETVSRSFTAETAATFNPEVALTVLS